MAFQKLQLIRKSEQNPCRNEKDIDVSKSVYKTKIIIFTYTIITIIESLQLETEDLSNKRQLWGGGRGGVKGRSLKEVVLEDTAFFVGIARFPFNLQPTFMSHDKLHVC